MGFLIVEFVFFWILSIVVAVLKWRNVTVDHSTNGGEVGVIEETR